MHRARFLVIWGIVVMCLVVLSQAAAQEPNLTEQEIKQFLRQATVISSRHTSKGVTSPWRLTLSDGKLTHDAAFQSIDEHKMETKFPDGHMELNFVDSYHYNIAGYELAKLLGMSDIVPVYVERQWNGQIGSLSWWIPAKWDEAKRVEQHVSVPDNHAWNHQMYKVRVFDQLIYDTDANLTNVLITEDWKIWRIDFTRAFRLNHNLQSSQDLVQCDRQLLEKLRQLSYDEVLDKTKPHLKQAEVKAVMARRDKIVAYFEKLIAQKGEGAVLY
jgi:hypothetical protein